MSFKAKRMQAVFIVLAYNLSQLLHEKVEEDQAHDDPDHLHCDGASNKKRAKRLEELKRTVGTRGDQLPLLRQVHQKASQLSVKFYRWLESHLYDSSPWRVALGRLRIIYEQY